MVKVTKLALILCALLALNVTAQIRPSSGGGLAAIASSGSASDLGTGTVPLARLSGVQSNYTGVVGTTTLNLASGNSQVFTFGAGNETLALSNIPQNAYVSVTIIQDGTGSRTITWPGTAKWSGGMAPTLSTGANARDEFLFMCDGANCYIKSAILDVR